MDYDDNDYQGQNLHLAGEGNSKFPPVLRPYALPKFDFDESLQGHLRFDSLAETEVFLGIENNEDNQWIDAYSRGSSGIEFSSSAAESCSISRRNNVWSEATSSESVEMLLKSVGQEDLIPRQTVIEESACDELACLAKQMEPNSKDDDKNIFKENVTNLQPPDSVRESVSELKEDVRGDQSHVEVSQVHEGESLDGNSSNQELNDICRNIDLPVSRGSPFTDVTRNNANQREVHTVADESLDDKALDSSSTSGVHTVGSVKNISSTCDPKHIQNEQNQVIGIGDEEKGCLPTENDKQNLESSILNEDAHVDNQNLDSNAAESDAYLLNKPLCSASKEEALEDGSVVEDFDTGASNVKESADLVLDGVCDLHKEERCNADVCSRNPSGDSASEDTIMLKDTITNDHSTLNTYNQPMVAIKVDTGSVEQVVEINNSSCSISPNTQRNVDAVENTTYTESSDAKEKQSLNYSDILDTQILVSHSEARTYIVEDNISNMGEGNSDDKVGGSSSFSVAASSVTSCILGESSQTCVNNEVEGQRDPEKFHLDASVNDKDCTKATTGSSQIHSDIDQPHLVDNGLGSLSYSGCRLEADLTNSAVSDIMAVNESASQVVSENTSLASSEMKDFPSSRSETKPSVGSALVEEEHSVAKLAEKADVSTTFGSSEKETTPCPVSETDKHQSSDTSGQLLTLNVGTDITEKISDTLGPSSDNVVEEVSSLVCESVSEQGDEVTVSFDKKNKEKVQEDCDKLPSKISGDILFANKGSISSASLPDTHVELLEDGGSSANPADISGVPSTTIGGSTQTQKEGNEVKGSSNQDAPISEFINSDRTNVLSIAQDAKGNNASKDEKSVVSEVASVLKLPKKASRESASKGVRKRQSFPATTAIKVSTVVEGSPSTSGLGPTKTIISGDVSHGIPQVSEGEIARSVSKGKSDRKTRRASLKAAGKESSRKGSQVKETTPARQSERGDKSSNVSRSPPGFQLMPSNELQQYGHIDSSGPKAFPFLNASTSSLPDLNTSASPPVLFQQPFTDLQQVQLRSQIFVYGALIQGTAPDEAYMISAFGGPDGGKSIWENAWRACMERQRGQKPHLINPETPLQPQSGPRASDFAVKQSSFQGKSATSPLGRTSGKAAPSVINTLIPLSSPLWSVPTPSCDSLQSSSLARGSVADYPQALTSLHPYQTPPLRNFIGHNVSWVSQTPIRGPWIASPTPAPDNSSHLSASPVPDAIKLNAVKGSSLPPPSSVKNVTPGLSAPSGGSPSIFMGTSPLLDTGNVTLSAAQHSSVPKPKKRKKGIVSQEGQKDLQLQSHPETIPAVSGHTSTLTAISTPMGNMPKTTAEKAIVPLSPLSPADHLKNDRSVEKILSEETLGKVKEARIHAEKAAVDSAAAVSHSLEIWNQLNKQKNSGMVPDIEAKLASAAVSIAAAAAVAKAAAAAANVASNAALQAKLMADEALLSSGYENSFQNSGISLSEGIINLGKATPASILKVANGTNSSSSIIVAAKEAARRRVEAASAATKRAENMDAIVKAAELAAEAVSQAGKIVTMGDPLPLSDLVEAGPEGCWRTAQESSQKIGFLKDMTRGLLNVGNGGESTQFTLNVDILSDEMGKQATANEKSPFHKMYNERSDDHRRSMDGITNTINKNERNLGPKGHKVSDFCSPINVVPESETELPCPLIVGNGSEKQAEVGIKEGSLIEVYKDGEGFKAAWFMANVLSVKDGKAYVCYTVLLADGGPLKEWVTLEGEGNKPPRIRIARPLTGLRYEGTRKRRRAAMGDYAWSVGDRVDAWIQESWCEGVITEKDKKDETTLTVYFPASGETSVVRAWHLRPSLIWKDGKWTEYSKVGVNESSTHESDAPHEKRAKLANHAVQTKGKDKTSKGIDAEEPVNPDELRLLDLTDNEKVFNIGKSIRNEKKPDTQRMPRTGLQKEGSRVIFGVPKPGKKRKFMEVSKHYVADRSNKINDGNDSVKLANFLMPQGSGSRGWKNNSKTEAKAKRGADSKPKAFKSDRPQNVLSRTIPPKNSALANTFSQPGDMTDRTEKTKDSASYFKNASESEKQMDSASDGAGEGLISYSSEATSTNVPFSKKASTSRANKGKLAPAGGKLGKIEEEKALNSNPVKATSEVIEPRRSNRRIQPTSRLLEGLQSSLIISKIPSASYDKNHKNQNRNAPRGHNQG